MDLSTFASPSNISATDNVSEVSDDNKDLRNLHFIYLGRKWCSNLNACVLSEAFMILCPPELLSSVKIETIAEANEDSKGLSVMPVKILAAIMLFALLFWFIFLR